MDCKVIIFDFDGTFYSGKHKYDNVKDNVDADRRKFFPKLSDKQYDKLMQDEPKFLEMESTRDIVNYMKYINQIPEKALLLKNASAVLERPETPEKALVMYNTVLTFFISLLPHMPDGVLSGELPGNRLKPALQSLSCQIMSVEDAAKICNFSVSRFAVLFKEFFGMSFGRYERLFRLNGAKEDLRNGFTLKEAAGKWSFCDKSHLARLLKKYE